MTCGADAALEVSALATGGVNHPSLASAPAEEVTQLFNRFRPPLLRYVYTLGLSLEDGEEVVQEVFLSLFQHLSRGKSRHNLAGWIFRVGHNLALKKRYSRMAEQPKEGTLEQVLDPTPSIEEVMVVRQRQDVLLAVVGALPELDRCCLNLRAEGLRYRQISEVLGISLGAVAMSLVRSIERLSRATRS